MINAMLHNWQPPSCFVNLYGSHRSVNYRMDISDDGSPSGSAIVGSDQHCVTARSNRVHC
jgi:hypothetical protein